MPSAYVDCASGACPQQSMTNIWPSEEVAMRIARFGKAAALGLSLAISTEVPVAWAAQVSLAGYQGAWALQGRDCSDVYSFDGKQTSFKKPLDIFAPAFMISGKRLRTPMASCQIKSLRPAGDRELLLLDCANAVAGSEVKVLTALSPKGELRRYYSDQDPTGVIYQRCSRSAAGQ
jgi:hypothetical protein